MNLVEIIVSHEEAGGRFFRKCKNRGDSISSFHVLHHQNRIFLYAHRKGKLGNSRQYTLAEYDVETKKIQSAAPGGVALLSEKMIKDFVKSLPAKELLFQSS